MRVIYIKKKRQRSSWSENTIIFMQFLMMLIQFTFWHVERENTTLNILTDLRIFESNYQKKNLFFLSSTSALKVEDVFFYISFVSEHFCSSWWKQFSNFASNYGNTSILGFFSFNFKYDDSSASFLWLDLKSSSDENMTPASICRHVWRK